VHVWTAGEDGKLPLLLLHMSPRSGRMYHDVMTLVDRLVAAPDRLGFGYSDPVQGVPTIERYASATLQVVDALGWDRFDVVGTHTGSVEAIEIASLVPDRVNRFGLVAIPDYTPAEVEDRLAGVAAPRPAAQLDGSHLQEAWLRRAKLREGRADPTFLQTLFVDEMLCAASAHLAYRAVLSYPTRSRLSELRPPVVVFAPGDDLAIQTERALPAVPEGTEIVRIPHLDFDLWSTGTAEMAGHLRTHFPWNDVSKSVRLANNRWESRQ
jgi:pimeloyl-ACP methyl ester carboxylesterase